MKRLICLALALVFAGMVLAFAGCSGEEKPDEPTVTTETTTEASTTEAPTIEITTTEVPSITSKPTTANSTSKTRPAITMNKETEKDGLALRVSTAYQHQYTGEPFTLTASITNTTDKDITYLFGGGQPNEHLEIRVRIEPEFIDMDTFGNPYIYNMNVETLKAGETFTESIRFLPGTASGSGRDLSTQEIDWYPAGEYAGTATFRWHNDAGQSQELSLEFPVILI